MAEPVLIPMFPLTLLPLPGELVPLHIFEPRYKQLLWDLETLDLSFGIYCNHEINKQQLGALMKLESIVKRYPSGEADIVVRCIGTFSMAKLYRLFKNKMYPGGDVHMQPIQLKHLPGVELYEQFILYQTRRNIQKHFATFTIYQIAQELNFDVFDRYRFLSLSDDKKESFLLSQLKFQLHVIHQEEKSKHFYHLN